MPINIAPSLIKKLESNQIFIFGSNAEEKHGEPASGCGFPAVGLTNPKGKGAALDALNKFGAIYGQSSGLQCSSYGIVTKDLSKGVRSIPLSKIQSQIQDLCYHANSTPEIKYLLTPIGTSNAGYSMQEIIDILPDTFPSNVWIPEQFAYRHISKNTMHVMFTGNRIKSFDSAAERDDAYSHLSKLINRAIKRAIEWGHDTIHFISGMALGVDTAACEFVLAQKSKGHSINILLTAAVPCLNQDAKWRHHDKEKYHLLLTQCDYIKYVSNCNYSGAGGAKCLDGRNKWLVSKLISTNDMAIAIHHGGSGGTQNCINDLSAAGKRTVIYNYRSNQFIKLGNW